MPVHAAFPVLGDHPVQRIAHVGAHVLVPVLIEAERARRVLDEEVQQARLVLLDLGELLDDRVGDEVGAARLGGEGELFLGPRGVRWSIGEFLGEEKEEG